MEDSDEEIQYPQKHLEFRPKKIVPFFLIRYNSFLVQRPCGAQETNAHFYPEPAGIQTAPRSFFTFSGKILCPFSLDAVPFLQV